MLTDLCAGAGRLAWVQGGSVLARQMAAFSLGGSMASAEALKYPPGDNSTKLEQVVTFGKQDT